MNDALTQVLPTLWRWRSSLAGPQQPVNSYVWRTADGCVLIDPAGDLTPAELGRLDLGPVRAILVTHVQAEHVAGCRHWPAVPVHVPAGDEYLCRGVEAYRRCITPWPAPWDWETRGNYQGHLAGAANERPADPPLNLGEPLRPGQTWQGCPILATPGHGKNAVTILATIAGRRVAFCGDVICGYGKLWNWFDCEWDYGPECGQRSVLASAELLARSGAATLCPAHGPAIHDPGIALTTLRQRLGAILNRPPRPRLDASWGRVETAPDATGFRPLLPHLHQYALDGGNCNVLVSDTGHALVVDDGLCYWKPLDERAAHHRAVFEQIKRKLGITRIDVVIPTHYHGDHTENIPELVAMEGARVIALDTVAGPIEHPERYNLACNLPWYGTRHARVPVDQVVPSGTRIGWQEYQLELFQLGGQTWHHCGIDVQIDGQRVLFAGDSADFEPSPVICYNDNDPETRGWAFANERLLERQPDLLVCGHCVAIAQPMRLLQHAQRLWQQELQRYRELSPHPRLRAFFDPFLERHEEGGDAAAVPARQVAGETQLASS